MTMASGRRQSCCFQVDFAGALNVTFSELLSSSLRILFSSSSSSSSSFPPSFYFAILFRVSSGTPVDRRSNGERERKRERHSSICLICPLFCCSCSTATPFPLLLTFLRQGVFFRGKWGKRTEIRIWICEVVKRRG